MFSKIKDKVKDKSEEVFDQHISKIRTLLREKVGIKVKDVLENDELMSKALERTYTLLVIAHPHVRIFISKQRFVSMGLSKRHKLLECHDARSLQSLPESESGKEELQKSERENSMPRDYLREATSTIFGDKVPLAELLETEPEQVIGNLLRALNYEEGLPSTMIRKGAAYALGQIGDEDTLDYLRERYEIEEAPGVKEALVASMTAINLAPAGAGYSQLERRQIIQDVYEGRRHPDWK